jgi:predicted deacetylase
MNEIQQGLDILSSAKLPTPSTFIPPAWHLSRQAIEALKDLKFDIAESMSALELIKKGKKYLVSPVLNWEIGRQREK